MIGRSLGFATLFLLVDLCLYFVLIATFSVAVSGLKFQGAVIAGVYALSARVLFLQAPIQLSIIAFLKAAGMYEQVLLVFLAAIVSLLPFTLLSGGGVVDLPKLFTFNMETRALGEGLPLAVSVALTWWGLRFFKVGLENGIPS